MMNLKNNLLKMGRTIFHQHGSFAPDCGMSYPMGSFSEDPDPSPTLFFYWHEPVASHREEIHVRDTRGWLSRLGLARKSA